MLLLPKCSSLKEGVQEDAVSGWTSSLLPPNPYRFAILDSFKMVFNGIKYCTRRRDAKGLATPVLMMSRTY